MYYIPHNLLLLLVRGLIIIIIIIVICRTQYHQLFTALVGLCWRVALLATALFVGHLKDDDVGGLGARLVCVLLQGLLERLTHHLLLNVVVRQLLFLGVPLVIPALRDTDMWRVLSQIDWYIGACRLIYQPLLLLLRFFSLLFLEQLGIFRLGVREDLQGVVSDA